MHVIPGSAAQPIASTLRMFNMFIPSVDPVSPAISGEVGMHTCGPTVYRHEHVGNLWCLVVTVAGVDRLGPPGGTKQ